MKGDVLANAHHHRRHAEKYPRVAYKRNKSNGKVFVYNNTKPSQLTPIAEIVQRGSMLYVMVNGKKQFNAQTIGDCLRFASEKLT